MVNQWVIRNIVVGGLLLFLLYLILKKKHDKKLNWAVFYAALWVFVSLLMVNALCIKFGFWAYQETNLAILIPYDLLFIWIVSWGIVLPYFFKGKYIWIIALTLFWLDFLFMPYLEKYGVLQLNENWLFGEVLMVFLVFIPSYLWAAYSYYNKNLALRSIFQVIVIAIIYCAGIPYITQLYFPQSFSLEAWYLPYVIQLAFIIVLPSLIAVRDLVEIGNGTPFPYDPTEKLVRKGPYAYIRNPIQWSLTFLFVPLAIIYSSPLLLIGSLVSFAYTIGISNPQEFEDMEKRFGIEWVNYKKNTPAWYFLWKPKNIPKGIIYFKKDCNYCAQTRAWLERNNPKNLEFKHAEDYKEQQLLQVTYIDHHNRKYSSVNAIANALDHINLCWAALGWFMRFPGINFLLQNIIDSMGLTDKEMPESKNN